MQLKYIARAWTMPDPDPMKNSAASIGVSEFRIHPPVGGQNPEYTDSWILGFLSHCATSGGESTQRQIETARFRLSVPNYPK